MVVLGVLFATVRPAGVARQTGPTGDAFLPWFYSLPRIAVPLPESPAPVTIVKVIDYQCPPCKNMEEYYRSVITRLVSEHPGAIRVETINYPLDAECNPYVSRTIHPAACEAAAVMKLAKEQGVGPVLERWLWDHQPTLSPESVFGAARSLGGIEDVEAAYQAALALVRDDVRIAHAMNVDATPAFFLNGASVGLVPRRYLEVAIRHELTKPRIR